MLVVVCSWSSSRFPMCKIINNFETLFFAMDILTTVVTLEFWIFAPLWSVVFGGVKGWTCISVNTSFCFSCQLWFLSLYEIEKVAQWWERIRVKDDAFDVIKLVVVRPPRNRWTCWSSSLLVKDLEAPQLHSGNGWISSSSSKRILNWV